MDFVEDIRVGQECAKTGFGAEVDRPSAVFGAGKILRVGITEDPPAERDEPLRTGFCLLYCVAT